MTKRWRRRLFAAATLLVVSSAGSAARFMMVETRKVPVQRLAENIERQLKEKPDDIQLRLNLARVYAMAYALKVTELEARTIAGQNLEPWFGHIPPYIPERVKQAPTREHQQRAQVDLARALTAYHDVITRAPENFLARLGYAWALEQAGRTAEAIAQYRQVVEVAFPEERKPSTSFWVGQDPATLEAIQRLEDLLDPVKDAAELSALKQKAQAFDRIGRKITPIAIRLSGAVAVTPLDSDARVLFDADGSGIPRRWTWIDKDAGWLVYDADDSGEITSALQWFGSVTFWLFWNNGYEALAALDDDGDRELRGVELRHLAIWRDANQNGVSEKGEVRSLAAHGIAALSCSYESGDGVAVAAYSPRGVLLGDGSTSPSYDVILRTTGRSVTFTSPLH